VTETESAPTAGHLEINQMTAVSLDARLDDGVVASGYRWKILEGEGGTLFRDDQEDAVFLAPRVEIGTSDFLIELTVMYADQPPSVRQLRVRVLSLNPDAVPTEAEGSTDGPQWLTDHYRAVAEAEEEKKGTAPTIVGGSGGPNVSIGVAGGSGGSRAGFRWSMSYPVTQPVPIPPPGQTRRPGEGNWAPAKPVPQEKLKTTFPSGVAKRYY